MPMRTTPRTVAAVIALLGVGAATGPTAVAQSFTRVFDGRSLRGWQAEHTEARAGDGTLTVEKGPGWVRNETVFADFVLQLEMRFLVRTARATIGVRGWPTFDEQAQAYTNAYGVELSAEGGNLTAQLGAWHRVRVECVGRTLRLYLDDALASSSDNIGNPQGYIAFGSRTGAVEFRAIEVAKHDRPSIQPEPGIYSIGDSNIKSPSLKSQVKPRYTADAMRARIAGSVLLQAVVLADGMVGDVRVLQSLDPGLDQEAIAAAKQWRFGAGTLNGQPVPVVVSIDLAFLLK